MKEGIVERRNDLTWHICLCVCMCVCQQLPQNTQLGTGAGDVDGVRCSFTIMLNTVIDRVNNYSFPVCLASRANSKVYVCVWLKINSSIKSDWHRKCICCSSKAVLLTAGSYHLFGGQAVKIRYDSTLSLLSCHCTATHCVSTLSYYFSTIEVHGSP